MLYEFLTEHRRELIHRMEEKARTRPAPAGDSSEKLQYGAPLFLTQLAAALLQDSTTAAPLSAATSRRAR